MISHVHSPPDTADSDIDSDDPSMKPQISVEGSPDFSRRGLTPTGDSRASPDPSRKVSAPSRIHQGIKAKLSAKNMADGESSPHISPHTSPRTSPRASPPPSTSLGSSPVPGGVKNRWKVSSPPSLPWCTVNVLPLQVGRKIQRMRTYHPRIKMKGKYV